ncbi:MAG: phosphoribosylamine--glycine ligase [Lactobacillaceae bacterium]|jgi:phosphoribosylamine--glycine ligase|nr:phosphoribosylamine--glycine ligase [Lactobacillaceae bacterium]
MAKVLVIGSGAREHAIAQTFLRSDQVDQVCVAPGNDGMQINPEIKLVAISATQIDALIDFAQTEKIDLVFVGSEEPLTLGIVDAFQEAGIRIFGPSQAAAQLEGSKTFANMILAENDIPTAQSKTVESLEDALEAVPAFGIPVVIKQDGLALGKGVSILESEADLQKLLEQIYHDNESARIVIEEYLDGVEFSIFSFVGENGIVHAPIAQDHKRLLDGDLGPNTGGMGAYSPVRWISDEVRLEAIQNLVLPTIEGMKKKGIPFVGVLYTGVMLTKAGPKVIEFNVRLGDPEAQVVLPQLTSDFYEMLNELIDGVQPRVIWQHDDVYLGVVVAAPGYPESPKHDIELHAYEKNGITINAAALREVLGRYYSNGGRIATFVTHASTATEAQTMVYDYFAEVGMEPLQFRTDIGYQAVQSEAK